MRTLMHELVGGAAFLLLLAALAGLCSISDGIDAGIVSSLGR